MSTRSTTKVKKAEGSRFWPKSQPCHAFHTDSGVNQPSRPAFLLMASAFASMKGMPGVFMTVDDADRPLLEFGYQRFHFLVGQNCCAGLAGSLFACIGVH